jgi:hypothetical protein
MLLLASTSNEFDFELFGSFGGTLPKGSKFQYRKKNATERVKND